MSSPEAKTRVRRAHPPPATHTEVVRRWPMMCDLSTDLGIPYHTVAAWCRRDSIPPRHWDAVVAAAKTRHLSGISYDGLKAIARERAGSAVTPPEDRIRVRSHPNPVRPSAADGPTGRQTRHDVQHAHTIKNRKISVKARKYSYAP